MNHYKMNKVFESLNQLKSAFKFGEKIVPIIQSLSQFMEEIVPLIENINTSIEESTQQMPKATYQIDDVTNATELATNEILDLVDEISGILQGIEEQVVIELETIKRKEEILHQVKELTKDNPEVTKLLEEYADIDKEAVLIEKLKQRLATVNEDANKITLSLQVQDITSQQLSAVNHLIGSVNDRLSTLVNEIEKSDVKNELETLKIQAPQNADFNPEARYDKSPDKQQDADEIVKKHQQKATQEEIDKLFS